MPSSPLRTFGFALLALVLTTIFVFYRFPYDRLARALEARAQQMAGLQLSIGELEPYFALTGFGLQANAVHATPHRGRPAALERLRVRPALSPSWLRGAPALHIDIASEQVGNIDGAIVLAREAAWAGTLASVDLGFVPFERIAAGVAMTGRIDADADIHFDGNGQAAGPIQFSALDGTLRLPGVPIDIPFKTFEGTIDLGGEDFARVDKLELRGPMVTASVTGNVGRSEAPGLEPLDMKLDLLIRGPALRPAIQQFGVPLDREGKASLQITGTLANPTFR